MNAADAPDRFSWLWVAFFLLIPAGFPLYSRFVLSDLPAMIIVAGLLLRLIFVSPPKFSIIDAWFLFFVGTSALGREVATVPGAYFFELLAVVFLFACFRAVAEILSSENALSRAFTLVGNSLIFILALNFLAVIVQRTGISPEFASVFFPGNAEKLCWPFQFSGQLGLSLTILFPVCIGSRSFTLPVRLLLYIMFLVNTGATGSRSVFWIALFEIFYAEFFMHKTLSVQKNFMKGLALCCSTGLTLLFFADDFSFQRSMGQIDASPLFFDEPRWNQIRLALRSLPVWLQGLGLGCCDFVFKTEIHNTPLSLIVETGLFGFGAACLFLFEILKAFYQANLQQHHLLKKALAMSLLTICFHAFFRNLVSNRACWLILAFCFSCKNFATRAESRGDRPLEVSR